MEIEMFAGSAPARVPTCLRIANSLLRLRRFRKPLLHKDGLPHPSLCLRARGAPRVPPVLLSFGAE